MKKQKSLPTYKTNNKSAKPEYKAELNSCSFPLFMRDESCLAHKIHIPTVSRRENCNAQTSRGFGVVRCFCDVSQHDPYPIRTIFIQQPKTQAAAGSTKELKFVPPKPVPRTMPQATQE